MAKKRVKRKSSLIRKIKSLPTRIQTGIIALLIVIFAVIFSLVSGNSLAATSLKTGTLDGYKVEINYDHEAGKTIPTVSMDSTNKSGTITFSEAQYGYITYKFTNLQPQKIYKVSVLLKTSNFSITNQQSPSYGALLGTKRIKTMKKVPLSVNVQALSRERVTSNNASTNATIYIIGDFDGEAEIYIGTAYNYSNPEKVKGTISFSNLKIEEASTSDIKVITSDEGHIKYVMRKSDYDNLSDLSNRDVQVQTMVNQLEDAYGMMVYFSGYWRNFTEYLFPLQGNPIVIMSANSTVNGAGALAGYPIEMNGTQETQIRNFISSGGKQSGGAMHETGHLFHNYLSSSDGSYHTNARYDFNAEMFADLHVHYIINNSYIADYRGNDTLYNDKRSEWNRSIGNTTNRSWYEYALLWPFLQNKNSAGKVDWEAYRRTFAWFNKCDQTEANKIGSSKAEKFTWFVKKLSQEASAGYTNILDVLKGKQGNGEKIDSGALDYILDHYEVCKIQNYGAISGDDSINRGQKKEYTWQLNGSSCGGNKAATKGQIIYTSSNPSVATVDDFGIVTALSKGTTVITASSIFQDVKATKTITVTDNVTVRFEPLFSTKKIDDIVVERGESVSLPNATLEGATFEGWYTDFDQNTATYQNPVSSTYKADKDVTLFPKFSFVVTYDYNGAPLPNFTKEYVSGAKITNPLSADPVWEGHTFTGWYIDESGNTQYNFNKNAYSAMTLYAGWKVNDYTVTLDANGGAFEGYLEKTITYTKAYGSQLVLTTPKRNCYTFKGWYNDTLGTDKFTLKTMPARQVLLYAGWNPVEATVTFDTRGGSPVPPKQTVTIEEYVKEPPIPVKEGYKFSGWYYTEEYDDVYEEKWQFNTYKTCEDLQLYAKWQVEAKYTITFDSKGGTPVPSITAAYGSKIIQPENPTRTGYTFRGWYLDEEYIDEFTFDTMPGENTKLYAKWEKNYYTITFDSNGGSDVESITAAYGEIIQKPTNPTKTGEVFVGWYQDITLNEPYTFKTMPARSFTLYAKWKLEEQHIIHFQSNGGGIVPEIVAKEGEIVQEPPAPTKEGHTFKGWYQDKDCTQKYTFHRMPGEDITLYAKWEKNRYTITFNSMEGSLVSQIEAEYGSKIKAPENPKRRGYTFKGWYEDSLFENKFIFDTMPARNIVLYAKWELNSYTIHFNSVGGSEVLSITKKYGEEVEQPENPTKRGHTFIGWYRDRNYQDVYTFTTMPDEDITLYAKWEKNRYTIQFESNGGSKVEEIEALYGEKVAAPQEPKKEGYIFEGWYLDKDTFQTMYTFGQMGDENIILYAKWTLGSYSIHFNTNGGSPVSSIKAPFATPITEPVSPIRGGVFI